VPVLSLAFDGRQWMAAEAVYPTTSAATVEALCFLSDPGQDPTVLCQPAAGAWLPHDAIGGSGSIRAEIYGPLPGLHVCHGDGDQLSGMIGYRPSIVFRKLRFSDTR
jgi:hypothetical protein